MNGEEMAGDYKKDNAVMVRMQEMCEESLCPDHFEMWETIKDALFDTRSSLHTKPDRLWRNMDDE